jgi:predicted metal-dependent phosphoesterase TrpH
MEKFFEKKIILQDTAFKELKKDYSFYDMHVHTNYSYDSKNSPKLLLKKAQKLGIGFAVTDHTVAEGAFELCRQKKVPIIPAIEVKSVEKKEVLLYFYSLKDLRDYYNKYIKNHLCVQRIPRNRFTKWIVSVKTDLEMVDIMEKSLDYACVRVVPHPFILPPYRSNQFFSKKEFSKLMKKVHAVEVLNRTMSAGQNAKAREWATKHKKGFIGGSDAHIVSELGKVVTASKASNREEFLDNIKKKKSIIIGNERPAKHLMNATWGLMREKQNTDFDNYLELKPRKKNPVVKYSSKVIEYLKE